MKRPTSRASRLRPRRRPPRRDRKSTRLNSSHTVISYAVFCLKKKKNKLSSITHITWGMEKQQKYMIEQSTESRNRITAGMNAISGEAGGDTIPSKEMCTDYLV